MSIPSLARRIAKLLAAGDHKLVTAESCTGGLVCGSLTRVPGISKYLCGGMVTYRNETKQQYLGISPRLLKNPGPVSEVVARSMAQQVLESTPEATIAVAVTGHLGPQAPAELDGIIYIAVAQGSSGKRPKVNVHRYVCLTSDRLPRQREAIAAALTFVIDTLEW